jgi:hypothetical protein
VSLTVFNSAGERVKQLYNGTAQDGTTQIQLLPGLEPGPDGRLSYAIDGILTSQGRTQYWAMDNDSGQPVSGGLYYVTMAITDQYNNTRTQSLAIQVVPVQQQASLEVYNSAGELVRRLSLDSLTGTPSDLLLDDGTAFVPQPDDPNAGLRLSLKVGSSNQTLRWDGLTSSGAPAASGTYVIRLAVGQPGQLSVIKTLSVTVLQAPALAAQASAAAALFAPNPVPASAAGVQLRYAPVPGAEGRVRVYNLAGELIATGVDTGGTGVINLPLPVSSGVYVADFGIDGAGGGRLARRAMKLAVIR